MVGLPDTSIREAKERVKSAIRSTGIKLASQKIIVNLAPANRRKEGSFFDLSIAVGILMATQSIKQQNMADTIFIGELSLNGNLQKIRGILPMCMEAKKQGIKTIFVPEENAKEAALVADITIIPIQNLIQIISHLNGTITIQSQIHQNQIQISKQSNYFVDFSDVKGQENSKRAIEVAASRRSSSISNGNTRLTEKPCLRNEFQPYYPN